MQKFTKDNLTDMPEIDQYIIKYDDEKQRRLHLIRMLAKGVPFETTERIYYGIPTVEKNGKVILQYAAYKKHISLLVGHVLPALLKETHPNYHYTDYTIVLPDNEPFPEDFVKLICTTIGELTGEDYFAKTNCKQ